MLKEFCNEQFVSKGMIADFASTTREMETHTPTFC